MHFALYPEIPIGFVNETLQQERSHIRCILLGTSYLSLLNCEGYEGVMGNSASGTWGSTSGPFFEWSGEIWVMEGFSNQGKFERGPGVSHQVRDDLPVAEDVLRQQSPPLVSNGGREHPEQKNT